MLKKTMLNLLRVSGAFTPFRVANRANVLILTYHRFSEEENPVNATGVRAFARHLEYLTEHYRVLPLSQISEHLATGRPLPAGAAAITIDDGYSDAYELAYPLLRQFRAPATLFVATDFVQGKSWLWTDKMRFLMARTPASELVTSIKEQTLRLSLGDRTARFKASERLNGLLKTLPDEAKEETIRRLAVSLGVVLPQTPPPEYAAVTWEQVVELDHNGVEIGSHTASHPILTNITDDRLRRELVEAKVELERKLRREVPLFCYPNGRNDARVQRAVASAGYRCAVGTLHGLNNEHSSLLDLRRIAPEPDLAHFVQSTSGFELLKLKLRGGRPLPAPAPVAPLAALSLGNTVLHQAQEQEKVGAGKMR